MSWSPTVYVQFPDETAARAAAAAIGVDFPEDGSVPTGNRNYAMHAPMQSPWTTEPVTDPTTGDLVTPGVAESGYWAMLRLNTEWPGFSETWAAIQATGAVRELESPPVVWAGAAEQEE